MNTQADVRVQRQEESKAGHHVRSVAWAEFAREAV